MFLSLIIIYAVTLLYLCSVERFRYYAMIMSVQGWLLFFMALSLTGNYAIFENIVLFAETSLVKGIIVPYMLFKIIRKTRVNHVHRLSVPPAVIVVMAVASLALSVWISQQITDADSIERTVTGLSIFGILVGLVLIVTHRRIFSHLVGFLVLENSVFIFSMTLGTEIPMLVNIAVTLDIFFGVLLLGFVMGKVSENAGTLNSEKLSKLRD